MTSIDERVTGFILDCEQRKQGILPPVDLGVECSICGSKIIGDDTLQFTKRGILCSRCLNNGKHGASCQKCLDGITGEKDGR